MCRHELTQLTQAHLRKYPWLFRRYILCDEQPNDPNKPDSQYSQCKDRFQSVVVVHKVWRIELLFAYGTAFSIEWMSSKQSLMKRKVKMRLSFRRELLFCSKQFSVNPTREEWTAF